MEEYIAMDKEIAGNEATNQSCSKTENNALSEEPSTKFRSLTTNEMSRHQIEESLTQIMERINNKRKEDMNIVETIKKELMAQASLSCQMIEEKMLAMHESRGKELDEAIKKVVARLDEIGSMEEDLGNSKLSLQTLFQEIQKSSLYHSE